MLAEQVLRDIKTGGKKKKERKKADTGKTF